AGCGCGSISPPTCWSARTVPCTSAKRRGDPWSASRKPLTSPCGGEILRRRSPHRGRRGMTVGLDFYFFYGSIHSYLSVMRIEALAAAARIEVQWRPFNLREILIEQNNTAFVKNEVKMNYVWHDVQPRAVRHGIPFAGRAPYPADPDLLALKVGLIAAQEGWCADYSRATFHDWFIERRAPGVADHVERILAALGKSPAPLIARAKSADGERL